jgi:hypothetical protein
MERILKSTEYRLCIKKYTGGGGGNSLKYKELEV